jgi:dihydroorotate dehydrogenase electron transfer subunit
MTKFLSEFKVIDTYNFNEEYVILELWQSEKLPPLYPGQFVQIKIENSPGTFLRRPFSIHDVDIGKNTFKILIQVVGDGTKKLCKVLKGESLNIIYPLGNHFTIPVRSEKVLLVGGGCGIAPLLFLGRSLKQQGSETDFLFGFRNSKRILEYSEYESLGKVWLTTEDGSAGTEGYVTDHPVLENNNYERIYCCGPEAMLKAIANHCKSKGIFCELTLENLMACGIGVCLCCVVDTVRGNVCSCTDGPVFNINDLKW